MIVTDDLPCNCRWCHVCAILDIAYPVARSIPEPTPDEEPKPVRQSKAKRRVATLFDAFDPDPAAA